MKQDGQFILMSPIEFIEWLSKQNVTRKINTIQQHHTYSPNNYEHFKKKPDEIYWMKAMKRCHTLVKKWQDIAQHFSTFQNGMICVGRSLELNPAGILGANSNSICIENVGDFDSETMSQEQKEAILILTAALCIKFNLTPNINSIVFHRWFDLNTGERNKGTSFKSCPGSRYFFGGNSEEMCAKNFIPLVIQKISQLNNKQGDDVVVDKSFIAKKVINTKQLNVREKPDANSKDIGDLVLNDVVVSTGSVGKFLRITFQNKDAYIHGDYVKDYVETDYKEQYEGLKKTNEELVNKIKNAINALN